MKDASSVLVTGSSRGIGRAIARAFAKRKYRVGLNFVRSEENAREAAEEVRSLGGDPLVLKADVGDSSQVKAMVQKALEEWGRIDVLVNNAGITRDRTIFKMNDDEWNEMIRVNLSGAFWCLRECSGARAGRKEGSIIQIASILGLKGSVGASNYSSAKAGLLGLTKSSAKELGRFNIRVNAVLPGFHVTDIGSPVWKKYEKQILSEHVLGRLTDLEELAEFVFFVSAQKSASGQIFNFDSRVF